MEIKPIASKSFESATAIILKDLEAIPEEAYNKSFGKKTRTVADIIYELVVVNNHILHSLKGEEPPKWEFEGWVTAPVEFSSKAASTENFQKSCHAFQSAISSCSEDDMARKVNTERGETDIFERCRFAAMHMWYHSGQLNYIQTLLEDDDWHW